MHEVRKKKKGVMRGIVSPTHRGVLRRHQATLYVYNARKQETRKRERENKKKTL